MPETLKKLTQRADDWNSIYPVGTAVTRYKLINPLREPEPTKTRSIAWVMGGHSVMVMVDGVAGGVLLESVVPVAAQPKDFFATFDEALNRHPHLLMEIGYNRVTDWMVIVWNASGVGIKNAPIIIQVDSRDRDEAMETAASKLEELFLSPAK